MDARKLVIGMAHRGRLNVLVNIFGKNPQELFEEFEGKRTLETSGDVKYHQGFSSNVMPPQVVRCISHWRLTLPTWRLPLR